MTEKSFKCFYIERLPGKWRCRLTGEEARTLGQLACASLNLNECAKLYAQTLGFPSKIGDPSLGEILPHQEDRRHVGS